MTIPSREREKQQIDGLQEGAGAAGGQRDIEKRMDAEKRR
tara:strand:+ start:2466 stop:2585 length:120 start_codon:yes stop_codon:yes gene_type:complete